MPRRLTPEQYENGRRLMTLAYAMIFTLPGIPSIYYGDEIGMQGYKDPFNERRAEAAVAAVCINRTEQQVRTVLLGRTVEVQPCSFAVVTDPE